MVKVLIIELVAIFTIIGVISLMDHRPIPKDKDLSDNNLT